jgi:RNA polymerase sigma-70 factor (ECF subfamily)
VTSKCGGGSVNKCTNDIVKEKYEMYVKMLYHVCFLYLKNRQDSEDAVQETFYRLICHSKKFIDSVHEKRWLLCVAKNICKNILKEKNRQYISLDDSNISTTFDTTNLEIICSINSLKEKYRDVILLYYFEGYDINEIAAILGIGISTVKMRLSRAKNMLRIELEDSL